MNVGREMGLYAAKCITNSVDELGSGGAFDLFVHSTRFFGHQVKATIRVAVLELCDAPTSVALI